MLLALMPQQTVPRSAPGSVSQRQARFSSKIRLLKVAAPPLDGLCSGMTCSNKGRGYSRRPAARVITDGHARMNGFQHDVATVVGSPQLPDYAEASITPARVPLFKQTRVLRYRALLYKLASRHGQPSGFKGLDGGHARLHAVQRSQHPVFNPLRENVNHLSQFGRKCRWHQPQRQPTRLELLIACCFCPWLD